MQPDAFVQALETAAIPALAKVDLKAVIPTLASCDSTKGRARTLCIKLYNTDNSFLRNYAILCHIYQHSLHNDFYTARDMLLMSRLSDSVHNAGVGTQVL